MQNCTPDLVKVVPHPRKFLFLRKLDSFILMTSSKIQKNCKYLQSGVMLPDFHKNFRKCFPARYLVCVKIWSHLHDLNKSYTVFYFDDVIKTPEKLKIRQSDVITPDFYKNIMKWPPSEYLACVIKWSNLDDLNKSNVKKCFFKNIFSSCPGLYSAIPHIRANFIGAWGRLTIFLNQTFSYANFYSVSCESGPTPQKILVFEKIGFFYFDDVIKNPEKL